MTQAYGSRDRYGLPLSTASATAVAHYVEGIDRLLSLNAGTEEQLRLAIEADEGFALPHAALAVHCQVQGRVEEAKRWVERARALDGGLSRRELGHVEAIATAVSGDGERALALIREHLAQFPRDALLLQRAASLIAFGGSRRCLEERFALLEHHAPVYGDDWWFLGAFSFAHHELDHFEESRRLAQRSLDLHPRNGEAAHNLAHIAYETGDHPEGAAFLAPWIAGYDRGAPFHPHLCWHLALFELASGHYDQAMALYDDAISPTVTDSRFALYDGASLLWRYQIYGCTDRALPWQEQCALAGRLAAKPGFSFLDAHAGLAFAAGRDEAALARLIDALRDLDAKGHPTAGRVTLPLVQGVAAFSRGDYAETIRQIEPIVDEVVRLGGSNAQRELFLDTLLEAYLRAGRFQRAETMLRARLSRRPSARDSSWLGRAQAGAAQADPTAGNPHVTRERRLDADPASPGRAGPPDGRPGRVLRTE